MEQQFQMESPRFSTYGLAKLRGLPNLAELRISCDNRATQDMSDLLFTFPRLKALDAGRTVYDPSNLQMPFMHATELGIHSASEWSFEAFK